ncbi:hypothetical protein [Clostridium cellulovorans]|uniref:Uncharacterized protein n=1 Tax=Clostridium cellulovorans (strain ATCC 35296 / DSM 3052 / OCM 3 / 743B) TaxID=573061 RepID=D9SSC6_CLOC7|nr:hypothetical protein [Clostridium cellulovorans]ADL50523.1 hypothetical protein Clocel_0753 [Clostridium cellulovorans 743B]
MKKKADILINDEYKRINIWDVLRWKQSNPEFWEKNKNSIYSINKNIEDKVPMVFQTGKNNIFANSYFRFKDTNTLRDGEGYEESYQHEFFKECFSRLKILNLHFGKNNVKVYVDEANQEEIVYTSNGRKRIVDVMIQFSKAEPMIYVEKWNGKLAIEVRQTHKVDDIKIKEFKDSEIAMVEFNASKTETKWRIMENFISEEDEEKQFERVISKLNNFIAVNMLSDPISKKYFSSLRLEEEVSKNELYKKRLIYMNNEITNLKKENQNLVEEVENCRKSNGELKQKLRYIDGKYRFFKEENESIKSKFIYKLFYKNK